MSNTNDAHYAKIQIQESYHVVPKSTGHESVSFLAEMKTVRREVRAIGPTILFRKSRDSADGNWSTGSMSCVWQLLPPAWEGELPS